jgi:hypothetical protein
MQRRFFILLIAALVCLVGTTAAQQRDAATIKRLNKVDEVNGASSTIYVHPEARLAADAYYESTSRRTSFKGYRVRIFTGSNQKARKEAEKTIESFRKKFSEPVYYSYVNPNFQVTCGNFLSIEDAIIFLEKAIKVYPKAHIVACEIPANTFVRTTPASIKAAARNEIVMEEDDPGYDMLMSDEDLADDPEMAAALAKEKELMANMVEFLPSKALLEDEEEIAAEGEPTVESTTSDIIEAEAVAKAAEAEAAAAAQDSE